MSSSTTNGLPANPFSQWKSTVNLDPNNTTESNLPDEIATLIFSNMAIGQVQVIMESAETQMDRYSLYRDLIGAKSSLAGTELVKFQRLLSIEGQTLIAGAVPALRSWAIILEAKPMPLVELKYLDLSDSTNISDADLIALSRGCTNLTTLILPGAFPSNEVMAVLRTNCPQAAIFPSAMTEQEWTHPAEFMAKLPPHPQEIEDFINGPRPTWEGQTASESHMIVPRVNKIVRNIDGRSVMVPWTLKNFDELDQATDGVGCGYIWNEMIQPYIDKPPEVGFEWIVFAKDVLPGSRDQTYTNQKQLVEHWGYRIPSFLDATTCMLWEKRLFGNRIYDHEPNQDAKTYTRCKERVGNWRAIAGGFAPDGVTVTCDIWNLGDTLGAGGLRKFQIQNGANELPDNPFSEFKSTVNLDPNNTYVANISDEIATVIFSKMAINQVQFIMESTETQMDRYALYRDILRTKSSLTGTELVKFQRLLSMRGQTLIAGETPALIPWSVLLELKPLNLEKLKHFDLSDSTNISDADLKGLTKGCTNLTKLILPGAFPSDEVMRTLKAFCPQAVIYPTAMTEDEWIRPAEFMRKLPPPPKEIKDFINGRRPMWDGQTAAQAHMIVPRVNKIVRNIKGCSVMVPWTLKNVSELDIATKGTYLSYFCDGILEPGNDKPSEVGFEWIVFTKDVLPGSRNQTYDNQKQLVERWDYEVPGFLDAVTCMLWENRISGKRIYNDKPYTHTRCKERIGEKQLMAGGFTPSGVHVVYGNDYHHVGIGGLKKF